MVEFIDKKFLQFKLRLQNRRYTRNYLQTFMEIKQILFRILDKQIRQKKYRNY